MPEIQFNLFYDEIYSCGLDENARFPVNRYSKLHQKLCELDLLGKILWRGPRLATRDELLLVHDKEYIQRFINGELSEKEVRRIGLRPWKKEIVERTLRLTGGAIQALDVLLRNNHAISGNMAGGTHHAFRGEGAGYCIFNDLAICAEKALHENGINRILILDLDVHQGDGTAKIFQGDERVYTVSLHGKNNFPFRKQVSDWDLAFDDKTEDEEYLESLDNVLVKLSEIEFDLVFLQAGVDGLNSDSLGLLNLTRKGLSFRNQMVMDWRRKLGIPMLIFMGGGYSKPIDRTVEAFADLFLLAAEENIKVSE
jgi:acetoin utilization deacetylase AcuC-like enzyme